RQLNAEGKRRTDLTRDEFVARVWKWKEQSGGTMAGQMRRLGESVDWSRDRFTMNPDLSRAVTEVFVRLYDEGLMYRGKRLVNWDPVLLTAVSDLEVESEEEEGSLWHLRYPLADGPVDGREYVVVATTRPETMLGDTAVAVNPDDERYRNLIGKQLRLPLTDRLIPIVGDSYADPAFGSGCVKITPAHDFNDYELGQRHSLPIINIFTPRAQINENAPERFRGLDRFEARKRVIAEFEAAGLLDHVEKHRLQVPRGDRTGVVLEPYLTDQWYVKIAPLAAPAIAAVEDGRTRFVPEGYSKIYFEWMRKIKDWCVSRQLWWGHRIPAWYDDKGNVHVGREEPDPRAQQAPRKPRAAAGRRRARHLVLLGALAVLDARVAGQDGGAEGVLSDERARHRLRHHLFLGGPNDDDGPQVCRRRAVPGCVHHGPHPRRARRQDVEIPGQRPRPPRYRRRYRPRAARR